MNPELTLIISELNLTIPLEAITWSTSCEIEGEYVEDKLVRFKTGKFVTVGSLCYVADIPLFPLGRPLSAFLFTKGAGETGKSYTAEIELTATQHTGGFSLNDMNPSIGVSFVLAADPVWRPYKD